MAEINDIRYETNTKGQSHSSVLTPFQKRMNITKISSGLNQSNN